MKKLTFLLLGVAFACGGSETPAPEAPMADGQGEHQGDMADHKGDEHAAGEKHEHEFPPMVTAFHDTLSPLWHAEAGEARANDTCAAIATLKSASADVIAAPVPEKAAANADGWKAAADGLAASVVNLETVCASAGRTEFDASFKAVHDAFHVLVAMVGHEEKQG